MKRPTCFKAFFYVISVGALACLPSPALGQRGGHGGGGGFHGGGGGFHGGGGGFRGGARTGGGGFRGGFGGGARGGYRGYGGRAYGGPGGVGRSYGAGPRGGFGGVYGHGYGRGSYGAGRLGGGMNARNGGFGARTGSSFRAWQGHSGSRPAVADGRWHGFGAGAGFGRGFGARAGSGVRSSPMMPTGWHSFGGAVGRGSPAGSGSFTGRSFRPSSRSAFASSRISSGSAISPSRAASNFGARSSLSGRSVFGNSSPPGRNLSRSPFGNAVGGARFNTSHFGHLTLGGSALNGLRTSPFSMSRSTGSRYGGGFRGSVLGQPRWGRGFGGRGFFGDGDFDFDDGFGFGRGFGGFGCWGCGFGFGWGSGWGWGLNWGWNWGWSPWWGFSPWLDSGWYDPWWYNPWWDSPWLGASPYPYYAPPPDQNYNYPPPYDPGDDGGSSGPYSTLEIPPTADTPHATATPSTADVAQPADSGSPPANLGPNTANVAESTPTVLLYLKDGTSLAASDYWLANGQFHYRVAYGGENVIDMNQLDLPRTVNENAKRGVKFRLKAQPVSPAHTTQLRMEAGPTLPS